MLKYLPIILPMLFNLPQTTNNEINNFHHLEISNYDSSAVKIFVHTFP